MVKVAQVVRALDCGSRGRGFESPLSPFRRTRVKRLFARTRYNGCEERQCLCEYWLSELRKGETK